MLYEVTLLTGTGATLKAELAETLAAQNAKGYRLIAVITPATKETFVITGILG